MRVLYPKKYSVNACTRKKYEVSYKYRCTRARPMLFLCMRCITH